MRIATTSYLLTYLPERALQPSCKARVVFLPAQNNQRCKNMAHKHHCCCECSTHEHHETLHDHKEHEAHESRDRWIRIALTSLLLAVAIFIEKTCTLPTWQLLVLYLPSYLLAGWGTLSEAWEGITEGDVFNENFLMTVATIGALSIGFLPGAEAQFAEAVFVMLFFQVGEFFEEYAEGKSRRSIAHLTALRPDVVHTDEGDMKPEEVMPGTIITVKAGERIPLDGIIVDGTTTLDTAALTGESMPSTATIEDNVCAGCVNLTGVIRMRTTKTLTESAVQKIIHLVEHAADRKSQSETFIRRFARIYTPVVVLVAIGVATLPPLFCSSFSAAFPTWLYRSLMFLVVSCPCALVISVPLTFFGGIGGASRQGILIKGSSFMDALSRIKTIVFDKTGTLTSGRFVVSAVHPDKCDERHLLHLAAHVEHHTTHPIGAALRAAFPEEATDGCIVSNVEEIAGKGIRARVGRDDICVGNELLMEAVGAEWHPCSHVGTIIHVAINGTYAGHIVIRDMVKPDSSKAIARLRALGVSRCVMLTGDREEVAADVAKELGLSEYCAALLPPDKVDIVERMLTERPKGNTLAFVGDGINDAPALARADVGIAMGGMGSDAAIDAADVVLMDDSPSRIVTAIEVARRTISIARQNIVFAIAIKVAVLILAVLGYATLPMAVFADVGVMVLAVLNAMRALR